MAAVLKTKSEIQTELTKVQKELTEFKQRVSETAADFASEMGYCNDSVEDFLGRLGLEAPAVNETICVSFQLSVTGSDTSETLPDSDIQTYIEEALNKIVRDYSGSVSKPEKFTGASWNNTLKPTGVKDFQINVDDRFHD